MKRLLALTSLVLLGSACDELEPFMPTVRFDQMDVQDIDFEQASVDFVFQVDNPNPIPVELSSFSYALGLEGQDLLSGDDADGLAIEAVGSSELVLPVDLSWQDAWNTVQATRGEDMVDFGLAGHFGLDTRTELGEVRVPYDEGGAFPALRTPRFRFQKVRVARVDLLSQTAELELDLGIDNDHGSTLFFDEFDYEVSLGGRKVGAGLIPTFAEVPGATEEGVTLPLDVDLLAVGDSAYQAIVNKKPMNVGLDARMDVDTPFGVLPLSIDQTGEVTVE